MAMHNDFRDDFRDEERKAKEDKVSTLARDALDKAHEIIAKTAAITDEKFQEEIKKLAKKKALKRLKFKLKPHGNYGVLGGVLYPNQDGSGQESHFKFFDSHLSRLIGKMMAAITYDWYPSFVSDKEIPDHHHFTLYPIEIDTSELEGRLCNVVVYRFGLERVNGKHDEFVSNALDGTYTKENSQIVRFNGYSRHRVINRQALLDHIREEEREQILNVKRYYQSLDARNGWSLHHNVPYSKSLARYVEQLRRLCEEGDIEIVFNSALAPSTEPESEKGPDFIEELSKL